MDCVTVGNESIIESARRRLFEVQGRSTRGRLTESLAIYRTSGSDRSLHLQPAIVILLAAGRRMVLLRCSGNSRRLPPKN